MIIFGLAGCHTIKGNDPAIALRDTMLTGSFSDARIAARQLLKQPLFTQQIGSTREDIIRFLGPPDYDANDFIYYRTGGGPLLIEFNSDRIIQSTHLLAPARWRGTDEELAAWWQATREQENWYKY